MPFHTINNPVPNNFVAIKNKVIDIEGGDIFKYFGIYLDEILHWIKHVE